MNLSRTKLFILCLVVIFLVSIAVLWPSFSDDNEGSYKPGLITVNDSAVMRAQQLYLEARNTNKDFSQGFCLSNDLLPGWVAAVNGSAPNLCQALLEGRAEHLVELDINGQVVRVK